MIILLLNAKNKTVSQKNWKEKHFPDFSADVFNKSKKYFFSMRAGLGLFLWMKFAWSGEKRAVVAFMLSKLSLGSLVLSCHNIPFKLEFIKMFNA